VVDNTGSSPVLTTKLKVMLHKGHLENCLEQYYNPKRRLHDGIYLGYMEACLVQFGVIESRDNGLADYALKTKKKFLFWEYEVTEDRMDIIIRLVKEYLNRK
jgi:hypothetical protein